MTSPRFCLSFGLVLWSFSNFGIGRSQEDDEFSSGLIAEYSSGGQRIERIDSDIEFAWDEAAPDSRLSAERFEVTWRGLVLVRLEAKHRLHAFVHGDVTVELDGQRVLHGSAKQPQWISGDEFSPGFGERPLVVTFRKTEKTAQLKLFWSSDVFSLEPLPPELLFHDATSFNPNANGVGANGRPTPAHANGVAVKQSDDVLSLIERGRQQFAAFRCGRCHVREGDAVAPTAPALQHVAAGMTAEQIVMRLAQPAPNANQASRAASAPGQPDRENVRGLTPAGSPVEMDRRMPHFRLNDEQARHLAAFLVKQSEPIKLDEPKPLKVKPPKEGEPVVTPKRRGELLLRSVGCLACHRLGELGNSNELPFAGPDLTSIGQRRSAAWLLTWLSDPKRLNADHRMPVFTLTDEERQLIVMTLMERNPNPPGEPGGVSPRTSNDQNVQGLTPTGSPKTSGKNLSDDAALGRQLFEQHRCAACHRTTEKKLAEFVRTNPISQRRSPIGQRVVGPTALSQQPSAISRAIPDSMTPRSRRSSHRVGTEHFLATANSRVGRECSKRRTASRVIRVTEASVSAAPRSSLHQPTKT